MDELKLFLLGSPRIELDNLPLKFDTQKAIALFAYLSVSKQPQRREALQSLLWPDYEPERASANLRRTLWALNKKLQAWLESDAESIGIRRERGFWLDVETFRSCQAGYQKHGHSRAEVCNECICPLSEAADLYQGDFLAGFSLRDSPGFDDWELYQTESLRIELAEILEKLARAYTAQNEFEPAIASARRWLSLDPLNEAAHRQLMKLYAWSGNWHAALRQYKDCERILKEEVGAVPDPETLNLYQAIQSRKLSQAPASKPESAGLQWSQPDQHRRQNPNLKSSDLVQKYKPIPTLLGTFIGREHQVDAITDRLSDPGVRLVTLTGPGGVGKTRISLKVIEKLSTISRPSLFADGIFFIPLAQVRDPSMFAPRLAQELGVREVGSEPVIERLIDVFHDRQALLVLDNFEQIIQAAPQAAELLAGAPSLKALVTSRELLHLYGEQEYSVPPLLLPNVRHLPPTDELAQNEAVCLFVARARAVQPDFALSAANAETIVEICMRLDGLPLAIELAAARLRIMPLSAIWKRLDQRLPLLTGGPRDLPAHQQTLRDTIEWSYDLLEQAEKLLFRRLSVFSGGCTLEAIDAIAGFGKGENQSSRSLPGTASRVQGRAYQPTSIELISALVEKSLVKRDESQAGGIAEPRFSMLETIREYALEQLESSGEVESFREWHAGYYLDLAEKSEAQQITGDMSSINLLDVEHDNLRASMLWFLLKGDRNSALRLCGSLWIFWWVRGHLNEGRRWLERILKQSQDLEIPARVRALHGLGQLAWDQGDRDTATSYYQESLDLAIKLGDQFQTAVALDSLGYVWGTQGYYDQAAKLHQRSLDTYRELGNQLGAALALNNLGMALIYQKEYPRARQTLEESLAMLEELGNEWGIDVCIHRLGILLDWQSGAEKSGEFLRQWLGPIRSKTQWRGVLSGILLDLTVLELYAEHYSQAERLAVESMETARDSQNFIREAAAMAALGTAQLLQGQIQEAERVYLDALARLEVFDDITGISHCLVGLAGVAQAHDLPLRAARLYGAAQAIFDTVAYKLPPSQNGLRERLIAGARAELNPEAFEAASDEGRTLILSSPRRLVLALEKLILGDKG